MYACDMILNSSAQLGTQKDRPFCIYGFPGTQLNACNSSNVSPPVVWNLIGPWQITRVKWRFILRLRSRDWECCCVQCLRNCKCFISYKGEKTVTDGTRYCCSPHHINARTTKGLTPLAKALLAENTAGAFFLLEKGADMNVNVSQMVAPKPKAPVAESDMDLDYEDTGDENSNNTITTAFAHCIGYSPLHGVMEWMMRHDNLDIQQSLLVSIIGVPLLNNLLT